MSHKPSSWQVMAVVKRSTAGLICLNQCKPVDLFATRRFFSCWYPSSSSRTVAYGGTSNLHGMRVACRSSSPLKGGSFDRLLSTVVPKNTLLDSYSSVKKIAHATCASDSKVNSCPGSIGMSRMTSCWFGRSKLLHRSVLLLILSMPSRQCLQNSFVLDESWPVMYLQKPSGNETGLSVPSTRPLTRSDWVADSMRKSVAQHKTV